jgi:hypothetical protein
MKRILNSYSREDLYIGDECCMTKKSPASSAFRRVPHLNVTPTVSSTPRLTVTDTTQCHVFILSGLILTDALRCHEFELKPE